VQKCKKRQQKSTKSGFIFLWMMQIEWKDVEKCEWFICLCFICRSNMLFMHLWTFFIVSKEWKKIQELHWLFKPFSQRSIWSFNLELTWNLHLDILHNFFLRVLFWPKVGAYLQTWWQVFNFLFTGTCNNPT
jgi:hypothetical protein